MLPGKVIPGETVENTEAEMEVLKRENIGLEEAAFGALERLDRDDDTTTLVRLAETELLADDKAELLLLEGEVAALDTAGDDAITELPLDDEGNEKPDVLTKDDDDGLAIDVVVLLEDPDYGLEAPGLDGMLKLDDTKLELADILEFMLALAVVIEDNEENIENELRRPSGNVEVFNGGTIVLKTLDEVGPEIPPNWLEDASTEDEKSEGRLDVAFMLVNDEVVDGIELSGGEEITGTATDVVESIVTVVVEPENTSVVVLVDVDGTVITSGVDVVEGLGKETVDLLLCPGFVEAVGTETRLLDGTTGVAGGFGTDGGLTVVVEVEVNVVVWPPDSVLVNVVSTLDVAGSGGVTGTAREDGVTKVTSVLTTIVVGPFGTVLVIVVRTPDATGGEGMGGTAEEEGAISVADELTIVVVVPPGTVLVSEFKTLDVTGGAGLGGRLGGRLGGDGVGGRPVEVGMTVVSEAVIIVVTPPWRVLVKVVTVLAVADCVGSGGAPKLEGDTGTGKGRGGCSTGVGELIGNAPTVDVEESDNVGPLLGSRLVIAVVTNVMPDRKVVLSVVTGVDGTDAGGGMTGAEFPGVVDIEARDVGATGSHEMTGVISGVLVTSVLNLLGGATPPIHSVVPLMTEK